MTTVELLEEALDKHREVKKDWLALMARANQPNITKERLIEEMFKIYLKLK